MSTLSQFMAAGSGGNPLFQERLFITSTTWTTPVKGQYLITGIGGGGGGGRANSNAGCGGAGGLAQSLVKLNAGVTLTITCGAGGIAGATVGTVGGNGGTTTISGSGLTTLTANGGTGGVLDYTSSSAAGGSASGGNIMNVTGGSGKHGGGAVGVYGVGYSGITASPAGAGVGGGPATSIAVTHWYPGTALFSGDELISSGSTLSLEVFVNPLFPLGGGILNCFKNGRFLSPSGGFVPGDAGTTAVSGPGCGGGGSTSYISRAGFFAGAPGFGTGFGPVGGPFGGGGGSGAGGAYVAGAGGCGGAVIEYIAS